MNTADHFSSRAEAYARFRPTYPKSMFQWLLSQVKGRDAAWDVGTGNGQVASQLASFFKEVYATDISENQLKNAIQKRNILYTKQPAEKTDFKDYQFDMITVAQAIHWFRFEEFYKEVNRTMKPFGLIVLIGYLLPTINAGIDALLLHFYNNTLGDYWNPERIYVEKEYKTILFPYDEIKTPSFQMEFDWTDEHFTGYLDSWSAVQHYVRKNNEDPMVQFRKEISLEWKSGAQKKVVFPLILKVGRKRN